ncbi:MAG TPA: DJ-1/PfpI family protein [Ktedonobacterales bacterium]|jgi:transcriptional regulator GlxA family with amidase domain
MNIGILIFDDVEVLDFCGPFEVFSVAAKLAQAANKEPPLTVFTLAERADGQPIRCVGGLLVQPHYSLDNHPPIDLLVVPGGWGTRREAENLRLIDWIRSQATRAQLTTSVCTGAFLLGRARLLEGHRVTTHWGSIERLRASLPGATVLENIRYIDEGNIVTSAGISAGIDMALHLVARLHGDDLARQTARQMEYIPAAAESA